MFKIDHEKCKKAGNCNRCIEACPVEALERRKGKIIFHADKCIDCSACVEACNQEAITL